MMTTALMTKKTEDKEVNNDNTMMKKTTKNGNEGIDDNDNNDNDKNNYNIDNNNHGGNENNTLRRDLHKKNRNQGEGKGRSGWTAATGGDPTTGSHLSRLNQPIGELFDAPKPSRHGRRPTPPRKR